MSITRRNALATAFQSVLLGAGLTAVGMTGSGAQAAPVAPAAPRLPKGGRILFQGDSITDGGRNDSDPNHYYGQDYAYLIAAQCGGHFPAEGWYFYNRGISGNTVADLAARWQNDALGIKPDLLSVLIGVNDAYHAVNQIAPDATVPQFEQVYEQILQQVQVVSPQVRIVLCEPFLLPVGRVNDRWADYQAELVPRQKAVANLADKHHAPLVRFQKVFTDACLRAPADYWIWDGIHPTYAGHQIMADEWLRTVNAAFG